MKLFAAAKRCCLGQSGFEFASAAVTYRVVKESSSRHFFGVLRLRLELRLELRLGAPGSCTRRWSSSDED